MKSLTTLIKLQKTKVDEQQLVLSKLQARLDQIQNEIAELEIRKTREQISTDGQVAESPTYGAFLKAMVLRGRELEKVRLAAIREVEKARDKLIELFEEQKRYEIAEKARIDAEASEERRKETILLDETGSISHQRGKDL